MMCGKLVVSTGKASIGRFQREFKIGFNRATVWINLKKQEL